MPARPQRWTTAVTSALGRPRPPAAREDAFFFSRGHRVGATARRRRKAAAGTLPPCASVAWAYPTLVAMHLFNSFAMLSANTAVFSLLFLVFNGADLLGFTSHTATLGLSATGAIIYSVVIGITTVVCNLVVLVAAMECCAGHTALLGACVQNG
ncbi:hypothetical protein GUJ93_ZPchr0001g29834 [Zizania palustris]|uniref:Uncharacterized protein n=1 Tax=Zizania palustris TaxID=103762 RepID=A0A8J5RS14_ZIZPA|nr:hypothetical protein GUJ93_ZPchr0001g29834 [Zizania palustris]